MSTALDLGAPSSCIALSTLSAKNLCALLLTVAATTALFNPLHSFCTTSCCPSHLAALNLLQLSHCSSHASDFHKQQSSVSSDLVLFPCVVSASSLLWKPSISTSCVCSARTSLSDGLYSNNSDSASMFSSTICEDMACSTCAPVIFLPATTCRIIFAISSTIYRVTHLNTSIGLALSARSVFFILESFLVVLPVPAPCPLSALAVVSLSSSF